MFKDDEFRIFSLDDLLGFVRGDMLGFRVGDKYTFVKWCLRVDICIIYG